MDYNARYYPPLLQRFISADSIVPSPGDPQALNRYSYVRNNPVLYRDPGGHAECVDAQCRRVVHPITRNVIQRSPAPRRPSTIYDRRTPTIPTRWARPTPPPSLPVQRGDILLENAGAIIPGDWDHASMIVSAAPENSSRMWVVEAERAHGVWHHEIDLSDNPNDWVILRVDTTLENRNAAAHWAEQLAGWDKSTDRQETSGAPFVSMIPFRDSPWGWFDIGAGKEGYYCFEVVVDAYQAQGVDITGRTQRLEDIAQIPYYPDRGSAMGSIALGYALSPNLGEDIYHSPNTYVIAQKEQR